MHDGEQVRKMNEVNSLYDGVQPSESGIMCARIGLSIARDGPCP